MIRSILKKAAVATATAGVLLSLSACTAHPGTALKINDTTWSEADVTEGINQFTTWQSLTQEAQNQGADQPESQPPADIPRISVINNLMQADTIISVGEDAGVVVTDDQILQELSKVKSSLDITDDFMVTSPVLFQMLRANIVVSQISGAAGSQEALVAEVTQRQKSADVELNPRYGTLDENNQIQQATPGDIVRTPEDPMQQAPGSPQSGNPGSGNQAPPSR